MKDLQAKITAAVLLSLLTPYASGQMPVPSAVAPQYSDADKKKIAEIEQRPEFKD